MKIDVGPYSFTMTDARRTLADADDILDFVTPAAAPSVAALRSDIADTLGTADTEATDALAETINDIYPRLLGARELIGAAGHLPKTTAGVAVQLNVSGGGVPKTPVDEVDVDFGGITTDTQATRRHHGRPFQALCLWSAEIIDAFAADGHPIRPGAAGENITITRLPWAELRTGVHLRIGEVLAQVMAHAEPCKQNAQWFSDGDFRRLHHRNGPISRIYAAVIEPGRIRTGDSAVLEP